MPQGISNCGGISFAAGIKGSFPRPSIAILTVAGACKPRGTNYNSEHATISDSYINMPAAAARTQRTKYEYQLRPVMEWVPRSGAMNE